MDRTRSGTLEQRKFERVIAVLQIKFYVIEEKYAQQLSSEEAYKHTTLEKLQKADRVHSPMMGVTENISKGGLALTSEEPLSIGQKVIVDMLLPGVTKPMRGLAVVRRSQVRNGKAVDKTTRVFNAGLEILAVNKDDIRRIENYIVAEKIKSRMGGR